MAGCGAEAGRGRRADLVAAVRAARRRLGRRVQRARICAATRTPRRREQPPRRAASLAPHPSRPPSATHSALAARMRARSSASSTTIGSSAWCPTSTGSNPWSRVASRGIWREQARTCLSAHCGPLRCEEVGRYQLCVSCITFVCKTVRRGICFLSPSVNIKVRVRSVQGNLGHASAGCNGAVLR